MAIDVAMERLKPQSSTGSAAAEKPEPHGTEPSYTGTRFRHSVGGRFWVGICVCLAGVVFLALLNESLSTGWRLYVIGRIFKAAWAATIALFAANRATALPRFLAPPEQRPARLQATFHALRIIVAALGYYLPGWNPWTAGLTGVALIASRLARLAASFI